MMGRRWRAAECPMHRARRSQAGVALIPALIGMSVIALTIVSLFALLSTVLFSTNAHRRTVRSGIEATSAIEAVRRLAYVDCEGAANMETRLTGGATPAYVPPAGYTVEIAKVRFSSSGTSAAPTFVDTCTTDHGLQEVTVRVTGPGNPDVSEHVVALKRDDTCPPSVGPQPGEKC